jgi:hypothetical protein
MTCEPARNAHVLRVIAFPFAILIALLTPAEMMGGSRASAKPIVEFAPQDLAPPLFLPVFTYGSGGFGAVSIAGADVNVDGKLDVVILNSSSVGVLLGNGDGTFEPAVVYDPGGFGANSLAVADVNGDGKPDLLVANTCSTPISAGNCLNNGTVGVLLGNGDGTFQTAVNYDPGRPGSSSNSIAVADVNGDGHPDLEVGNFNSSISILLGHGDGTFQLGATYSSEGQFSLAVADVNGDGRPDLLVTNLNNVGVRLGNGDGTFQAAVVYDPGGFDASSVTAKDVNGDGRPDLLVTDWFVSNQDFHSNGVVGVLLGNGDGTFQPAITYDSGGQQPSSIALADANGDGQPDVVVENFCASSGSDVCLGKGVAGVLLGKGAGTFEPPVTFDSGGFGGLSIAAADLNGDGQPDLVAANYCATPFPCVSFASMGVLLNNAADTTPPVISISTSPKVLWPPNHKMVPVRVSGRIGDTGSGVNAQSARYAVKDEYGDIQPRGGITLGSDGAYSFTVLLQASRRGTDRNGRRYRVTVRARDAAGNRGAETSVVTVPHDQRH